MQLCTAEGTASASRGRTHAASARRSVSRNSRFFRWYTTANTRHSASDRTVAHAAPRRPKPRIISGSATALNTVDSSIPFI